MCVYPYYFCISWIFSTSCFAVWKLSSSLQTTLLSSLSLILSISWFCLFYCFAVFKFAIFPTPLCHLILDPLVIAVEGFLCLSIPLGTDYFPSMLYSGKQLSFRGCEHLHFHIFIKPPFFTSTDYHIFAHGFIHNLFIFGNFSTFINTPTDVPPLTTLLLHLMFCLSFYQNLQKLL